MIVINEARLLLAKEDSLLYVAAPCRVVSDLHGQFADLMHIMGWCGAPDGSVPWVFLGDYVDRTDYGCEVMLLLYSLKIKWPDRIFLLRGNHEIDDMNSIYGFKEELTSKWGLQHGTRMHSAFNESFAYMPLAAIATPPGYDGKVDSKSFEDWREHTDSVRTQLQRLQPQHRGHVPDRYLMMHGGIGRLEWLSEIAAVKRPLHSCKHHAKHADVLSELVWSDPAPKDTDKGLLPNKRDGEKGGIICYGADRVKNFCKRNHVTAILRGHEHIHDGLEVAFGGRVLTFFSATNYTGKHSNHGVILHLAPAPTARGMPSMEVQPIRFEAVPVDKRTKCKGKGGVLRDDDASSTASDATDCFWGLYMPSDEEVQCIREMAASEDELAEHASCDTTPSSPAGRPVQQLQPQQPPAGMSPGRRSGGSAARASCPVTGTGAQHSPGSLLPKFAAAAMHALSLTPAGAVLRELRKLWWLQHGRGAPQQQVTPQQAQQSTPAHARCPPVPPQPPRPPTGDKEVRKAEAPSLGPTAPTAVRAAAKHLVSWPLPDSAPSFMPEPQQGVNTQAHAAGTKVAVAGQGQQLPGRVSAVTPPPPPPPAAAAAADCAAEQSSAGGSNVTTGKVNKSKKAQKPSSLPLSKDAQLAAQQAWLKIRGDTKQKESRKWLKSKEREKRNKAGADATADINDITRDAGSGSGRKGTGHCGVKGNGKAAPDPCLDAMTVKVDVAVRA
ncbi:hypothetical protein HYH02_010765 [Chlamydomonas schloesseri]|uniref:Serine/threonine-protein phosphatase n=1 Tax=Chlamydomonas schloesseri TaxID=2026947 RepID=A0A835W6B8_9CHLO|nr:hypothetical protein HYH02_010765 [Chlamydomonas schloesseri]|eukprot:KAG2438973.1 hypothetical protein HYH02_010765 [Chlamydomonas schloesseri]